MASPMFDRPEHLPMHVTADGVGPAEPEDAVATVCWTCDEPWPCAAVRELVRVRRVKHAPMIPEQLRHPGGKDGMWVCRCMSCSYYTAPWGKPHQALLSAVAHCRDKNKRKDTP
jgi:hypothetical protein